MPPIENIGTIRTKLEGDVKDLTAGIALAKKDIKGFGAGVPGWVKPVGVAFVAAGAVVTGALTKMIFDAGAYGDEIEKMSQRTGISAENLTRLKYAAEISGSSLNAVENSARFLARAMDDASRGTGEAKDTFLDLGISATDAEGNLRPVVDVMLDAADKIAILDSETAKVAATTDLFGSRMGTNLLPMLKKGRSGIEELTSRADELGLVMSTSAAEASAEFTDRLGEMKSSAKMASFELGQVFLPVATGVIDKVTGMVGWFSRLSDTEQKVVGWGAAASGGFMTTAGAGLLVVGMLPKLVAGFAALKITRIASGFALAGASAGAFASVLWMVHRAMKVLNDPASHLTDLMDDLNQSNAEASRTVGILKGQLADFVSKGVDPATVTMGDLDVSLNMLGKDLGMTIEPTRSLTAMIALLEGKLEKGSARAKKLMEEMTGLRDEEDLAKAATDAVNKAIEDMNKALIDAETEWGNLTKSLSAYTDETGEGYRANELQLMAFIDKELEGVEKGSKAWVGATNRKTDLMTKMYAGFEAIAEAGTITEGEELGKRAVLDTEHVDKIKRNAARRVQNASEALEEEKGIIRGGFDWEIFNAAERTQKLISERAKQYSEESRLYDKYLLDMSAGEERMLQVKEMVAAKDLEILNRGHAAAVASEIVATEERIKLGKIWLDSAQRQVQQEFDFKKDLAEMTQMEATEYLKTGQDAVMEIYDDFKPFFQQYNLDLIKLDTWRADQMLAIEKKLAEAKKDEIAGVYEDYATHLKETEEFWSVDKGFKNPYGRMTPERDQSFSEQALYYGLQQAIEMRGSAEPAQAPTRTPYTPTAGATAAPRSGQGDININIYLENLYGGEEATLNNLAEDIARRIRGQNIHI